MIDATYVSKQRYAVRTKNMDGNMILRLVGSKPVRSNVTVPTASLSRVYLFTQITSCAMPYDVIYHPFPINSQYLKTWGVDSPALIDLLCP